MGRGPLIVLLGLVVTLAMGAFASAASANLYPPGGFRLPASNGYWIHAIALDGGPHGEHDEVLLYVSREGSAVVYVARKGVEVTETTVSARIGGVGSLDLHFVPSGKPRTETSICDRRPIEFDSGFYEGRFDFKGEEGFAAAHTTRARGEVRFVASLICSRSIDEGFGGHSPGARLVVRRHWHRGGLEFTATKNSPTRPARFRAAIQEWRDGLPIAREVSSVAGAGAFEFDVPAQRAQVAPPAPFSGLAHFTRPGELRGNLSVDFPGHSDVSLGGARGSLQRWVQNPSHPFRIVPLGLRGR